MMYIENIFVLLAAPLVASLMFVSGRPRSMVAALLSGMFACLLSSYVSSFFVLQLGSDAVGAAVEVVPVVEETIKLLPLLFYLIVIEPQVEDARLAFVFVAVGFATMESALYLADNGVVSPTLLALRGFGAAMMHLTCGVVMGYGFVRVWERPWLKAPGTFSLLCLTISYHGLYNLFVAAGGAAQVVAVVLPLATLVLVKGWRWRM